MADHIRALACSHDITVLCNFSNDDCSDLFDQTLSITLIHVPIKRRARPFSDLAALISIYRILRKGRFSSVHSIMPKAGLIAMIAGWLARVPIRVHMFTGQVWVTQKQPWRGFLKAVDRLIGVLATDIFADSPSQLKFLVDERVIKSGNVLGEGSVNGVDCERYKPNSLMADNIRSALHIPNHSILFGFVGRLSNDKGVLDLVQAFSMLPESYTPHLLLVGPDEDEIEMKVRAAHSENMSRIHFLGYTSTPEEIYTALDVFCIPSYREGFGSSVIEAAACGVPALASRIYGLTDSVVENETGLLHRPGDVEDILRRLKQYLSDPDLRTRHGTQAMQRVHRSFTTDRLTAEMRNAYKEMFTRMCGC
ncbi:MAG: glycosyltransferase family 4 protein [Phycisphaerales bacterium]|nr:glycosyltransferase family 4 protein [Phycisphaerales bacterium]